LLTHYIFKKLLITIRQLKWLQLLTKKEIVILYEEQLFPHGGGGLLGYKYVGQNIGTYSFDPKILESWDSDDDVEDEVIEEQAALKQITAFRLDTSTFLIVDLANMDKLVGLINYDDLIDAMLDNNLDKYFDKINQQLGNQGWGFCKVHGDSSFIIP